MRLEDGWTLAKGKVNIDVQVGFVEILLNVKKKDYHMSILYSKKALKPYNDKKFILDRGKRMVKCGDIIFRHEEEVTCFINFTCEFFLPHENDKKRKGKAYRFLACPAMVTKLPGFKGHVSLESDCKVDKASLDFEEAQLNYKLWFAS